jgi:hypothetical protein
MIAYVDASLICQTNQRLAPFESIRMKCSRLKLPSTHAQLDVASIYGAEERGLAQDNISVAPGSQSDLRGD